MEERLGMIPKVCPEYEWLPPKPRDKISYGKREPACNTLDDNVILSPDEFSDETWRDTDTEKAKSRKIPSPKIPKFHAVS